VDGTNEKDQLRFDAAEAAEQEAAASPPVVLPSAPGGAPDTLIFSPGLWDAEEWSSSIPKVLRALTDLGERQPSMRILYTTHSRIGWHSTITNTMTKAARDQALQWIAAEQFRKERGGIKPGASLIEEGGMGGGGGKGGGAPAAVLRGGFGGGIGGGIAGGIAGGGAQDPFSDPWAMAEKVGLQLEESKNKGKTNPAKKLTELPLGMGQLAVNSTSISLPVKTADTPGGAVLRPTFVPSVLDLWPMTVAATNSWVSFGGGFHYTNNAGDSPIGDQSPVSRTVLGMMWSFMCGR
jgi:hypothetical protein